MNKKRALSLAREWAQGHRCTLQDGEAAEYHAMFASMLEAEMLNKPLQPTGCHGCYYLDEQCAPCAYCIRGAGYADYFRRPPEGEEGDANRGYA